MKLTIEQQTLAAALKRVIGVVPNRASIPMLQNVLITTEGDNVSITATDMDVEATVKAPATVHTQGGVTVSAKMLSDTVNKLDKGALVSLDLDDGWLSIKAGRSRTKAATLPVDDFPHMASDTYEATIVAPAYEFSDMFDKTAFAASTEETRYYLNGVYLCTDDGRMTGIATDGHRLARWRTSITDEFPAVIVPSATVSALQLPDAGDVTVSISATKIRFATDDWCLVSKVVDGTYPDVGRVIPDGKGKAARFNSTAMKRAVDKVGVVLDKTDSRVRLEFAPDGITLTGHQTAAQTEDVVDAACDDGIDAMAFNYKYLSIAMAKLDGDAIMTMKGAGDPALIHDDASPDWTLVVMPMRS